MKVKFIFNHQSLILIVTMAKIFGETLEGLHEISGDREGLRVITGT
jgi:hypothetical protein